MKLRMILLLGMSAGIISSCQKDSEFLPEPENVSVYEEATLKSAKAENSGFVHGIMFYVEGDGDGDGEMYYFKGPVDGDGEDGSIDVPGHTWVQAGNNKFRGKHYNTGPWGMPQWWSLDADDGALLYNVAVIIDEWTSEKAEYYASRGFVHYHEIISVATGEEHPTKIPWLKHTAVTSFTLNGGPGAPNPPYEHKVSPGIDWEFPNNYWMPYNP